MRWTKRWARRLRTVLRRDAVERELDEEMTFHFQMEVEKNVRAGMAPAEARRRAGIAFGGVEKFKEEVRDARAFGWVSGLSLDLKLGLRMLRPGGSVVCAGIHMSDIPSFPYADLWRERSIRSVANLTRADGDELLALAPRIPIRTTVSEYPLERANDALADLRSGRIERGGAVLRIAGPAIR